VHLAARDATADTHSRRARPHGGLSAGTAGRDAANGVPLAQLASLVRLGGGEHVIAVDDRAVTGDLAAGATIATLEARPRFVDLTVAGGRAGERRVVLLLH
jgi:hypothetical protein